MSKSGDETPVAEHERSEALSDRPAPPPTTSPHEAPAREAGKMREPIFEVDDVSVSYSEKRAVRNVTMNLHQHEITALIGPSGCGKSTFIRCLNRMNDLIPAARVEGKIGYHGENLYDTAIDPVQVRKRIGMVFQKPNPFPKSIYDNIAFGPRVMGMKG